MSVVPSFDIQPSSLSFSQNLYEHLTQDYGVSAKIDPTMTYKGTLPKSGKAFTFGIMKNPGDVQHMLKLQEAVAKHAQEKGTGDFLVQRTQKEFQKTIVSDSYYGAWCDGELVAMFKLGKHDDELKKDGRGEITPRPRLGVKRYNQVMILGAAQVHPDYLNEGIGLLGTLFRDQEFIDSGRDIMMTKIHADNEKVQQRYMDAGFIPVFQTAIDCGKIITYKADRSVIQDWLDNNTQKAINTFDLQIKNTDYRLN